MYEQIDQFVDKCIQLTDEEREYFHSLLKFRRVRKRTYLLQEGEVCDFEAFIVKGLVRTYFLSDDGTETILSFAVENWWVSDLYSFTEQKPTNMFIETLEDSELLLIDYKSKQQLFEQVPQFETMFRLLVQRSLFALQRRFHSLVSQTAEQRYIAFTEKYPEIVQRVPQNQIARYLGVSPEFLSKVRGAMHKKK
ncbi:cAMP-binding domain of CRP or a regulatory subunit of cAMP-dependent protein kinases [Chitinophaga jiangningensis]|uniref:cAMP-binding domain of CRP or a regulatory subunit of cAMP-dependent protein kinases n=1 Tax=Chitinophaga jiangningensis TaxID=1419482 RepID=A0A1M7J5F1_9BACT|nr:Crp/Fnr family transcriptional regulator [Chitinophaga jiangningensis]SHM48148.1 cAMP-binding domain of CRP or a regulatory subunit of cAMP-dependent protein kinases [Chitinophaga jiangningensis]